MCVRPGDLLEASNIVVDAPWVAVRLFSPQYFLQQRHRVPGPWEGVGLRKAIVAHMQKAASVDLQPLEVYVRVVVARYRPESCPGGSPMCLGAQVPAFLVRLGKTMLLGREWNDGSILGGLRKHAEVLRTKCGSALRLPEPVCERADRWGAGGSPRSFKLAALAIEPSGWLGMRQCAA